MDYPIDCGMVGQGYRVDIVRCQDHCTRTGWRAQSQMSPADRSEGLCPCRLHQQAALELECQMPQSLRGRPSRDGVLDLWLLKILKAWK